jgi:hypothetical protein
MLAVDFFHIDCAVTLRRLYVLLLNDALVEDVAAGSRH